MEKTQVYELENEIAELQGLNHKVAALGDFFLCMEQSDFPNITNGFFTDAGEVITRGSKTTLEFLDQIEFQAIVDEKWLKEIQAKAERFDALIEGGKIDRTEIPENLEKLETAKSLRGGIETLQARADELLAEATQEVSS